MRGFKAKRAAPRIAALWPTLLVIPLLCNATSGQVDDGGPIIIDRQQALEFFRLTKDHLAIEFRADFRSGQVNPTAGNLTKDTETRYREVLEYGGEAYFGHPNLFELEFLTRWRLEQREFEMESRKQSNSTFETLVELDFRGTFLRRSNTPISVFASRNQTTFERDFGGTLDNTRTEFGITARILKGAFPSEITLRHIELTQENSLNRTNFEQIRDILEARGSTHPGEGHRLWWDATLETVAESGNLRRANSFDRIDLYLNEEFRFGKDQKNRLLSTIRFRDETGSFAFTQFRWDERLRIVHTESLEADYILIFDKNERPESTQTFMSGAANFRHQLFDSLTTTGETGMNQLKLDEQNFTSTNQFGQLGFDYTKIVPYGKLFATANLGVNFQAESERGSPIFLNDQAHTFGPSGIIVLPQRNITRISIVVTDLSGTISYSLGIDYLVDDFGERTEIRRIPGGLISPNQTVLVDFEIGPEPGSTTNTLAFGFSIRYDFEAGYLEGLSIYGRYREMNQDRDSVGGAILPVSDLQELTYGAEYTFWRFTLLAEQKIYESTLAPFDSTRLEVEYRQKFNREQSLQIRGFHQTIDRGTDNFESTTTNLTARFSSRINNRWSAHARVIYREETASRGREFRGFEQKLELLWRHRQTTFSAALNNSWSKSDANDNNYQTFAIMFRREF